MTQTPRASYQAWLDDRGARGDVLAGPKFGESPYDLLFVGGPPGVKLHPAAVSGDAVVVPKVPAGWRDFLQSAPPSVVQDQIGWLHGAWASHAPSRPITAEVLARDPKAATYVREPTLTTDHDGRVVYEAFYGEPPRMEPFRFRAVASPDGEVTFTREPLWKLP